MPPPDPDAVAADGPPLEGSDRDRPLEDADAARARRGHLAATLYATAAALWGLDRLTKYLVEHHLHHSTTLIPGVLQLQFARNPGGAFGLFGGATWLFLTATIAVSGVIVFASLNLPNRTLAVALGLVFGGAIGNLTDRLLHGPGLSGRVTDFLAFAKSPDATPVWPVFNVADTAIVVGAGLILLASLRRSVTHR